MARRPLKPGQVELFELDQYVYDKRTGQFHGPLPSYKIVGRQAMMDLIEDRVKYHADQMEKLTRDLYAGRMNLPTWERLFATEMKNAALQQAALAKGGWQNMTSADFGRVGRFLREQYKFLDGFAKDIKAGRYLNAKGQPPMSPQQAYARSRLYGQAGRQAYWVQRGQVMKEVGRTQERRIARGDGRTCGNCEELARLGWRPIGTLPAPGGPPCKGLTLCRCEKEYR